MTPVAKILRAPELETFRALGAFAGSPDDLRDGFIHLSYPAQVAGTLGKHFVDAAGKPEVGLSVVVFDPADLGDALRFEASRGGQMFPHFYGVLAWDQAGLILPIPVEGGNHLVPDLIHTIENEI